MASKKKSSSKSKGSKSHTKSSGVSTSQKVGLGIGLTAAAAAAAGAYFLYGSKNAAKNRKAVKSWMLKAKAEVLEGLERAQEMSKKEYEQLIDQVGTAYAKLQDVKKTDLADFKREMKQHWDNIAKEAKAASQEVTGGAAKKAAKKGAAKKAAKKSK